jgi:formylmethanofuran dehydrogenase subunit E
MRGDAILRTVALSLCVIGFVGAAPIVGAQTKRSAQKAAPTTATQVGPPVAAPNAQEVSRTTTLAEITFVHGNAEPFAVAGFRMGERALKEFKLQRGSFLLEVLQTAPEEVQWSCVADGVQVSTGASEGKLNLKVTVGAAGDVSTSIRDRRTEKTLVFRLTPQFVARYLTVSHEKLDAAGAEVLALPDEQIFVMASAP